MSTPRTNLLAFHPSQRLKSPSRGVSAVVHAVGLISFANSFRFLHDNPNEINLSWGSHWQYLTIIGLSLATLTFVSGLLADLTLSSRLFYLKNALSVATAPMEVLISILYWSIQAIDPRLLIPEDIPILPRAADFGFHAAPALLLTIDLLLLSPPWTISALPAFGISGTIAALYWFWVEACYAHNGFYPYPLFNIPTVPRIGLFVGAALVMSLSTYCLKLLYVAINGVPIQNRTVRSKIGIAKSL